MGTQMKYLLQGIPSINEVFIRDMVNLAEKHGMKFAHIPWIKLDEKYLMEPSTDDENPDLESIKKSIKNLGSSEEYYDVIRMLISNLERDIRDWRSEMRGCEKGGDDYELLQGSIDWAKTTIGSLNRVISKEIDSEACRLAELVEDHLTIIQEEKGIEEVVHALQQIFSFAEDTFPGLLKEITFTPEGEKMVLNAAAKLADPNS